MTFSTGEYQAVRTGAGLIDRSERGKIAFAGRDRATYLQGLLTNDIVALRPGQGCYAAYLTPQGRMIADMRLVAQGDQLIMDVNGELKEMLLRRFDQFIFSEQVTLRDLTSAWAELGIHGPASVPVVASALQELNLQAEGEPQDLAALDEHQNVKFTDGARFVLVVAARGMDEKGFDLYVPRPDETALRAALRAAGAIDVSEETAEVLRIEAGVPRFGIDMDEETLPLEAGLETRAISLTKGCYVGQEVIVRVLHRGHGRVARKLVGLSLDGDAHAQLPSPGDQVNIGDRAMGRLTSVAASPRLGRPVALGYLYRDFTEPGTRVTIAHNGGLIPATVTSLPFRA